MEYFIERICEKCGGPMGYGAYHVTNEEFDRVSGKIYHDFSEINHFELPIGYQELIAKSDFRVKIRFGICCGSGI